MKQLFKALPLLFFISFLSIGQTTAQTRTGTLLWPDGITDNPVNYGNEKVREAMVREGAPSGKNRVFSQVSLPTYDLYGPGKDKTNGVAMVICPGGGFRDVWFDREGVDPGGDAVRLSGLRG